MNDNNKRKIEIFSAGCPACESTVHLVKSIACPSCEVHVLDMKDAAVAAQAKEHGVTTVPAVVVDGQLATCCTGVGAQERALRAAGVGIPR
ncbi:MAG: thioredoxin family protein [Bryobacteraceae bacterium]